jgi:ribosomal protein S18 acetylase RimI-like enzyme
MMNGARVPGVLGEVEIFVHSNEAGRQTGFISVEWRNGTANIHGVAVSEEFRRQGIAARLLDHVIESASLKRITSFECITAETENLQALSFFENKEFIVHGFAGSYPRGQRAVRLKRDHSF